jgi:hypothetical protein
MPKHVLAPVKIASAQSLTANFTTVFTDISFQDNIAYQINVTTTDSAGSFDVQASLDGINFVNLNIASPPTIVTANISFLISLNQLPYKYVRLSYTNTTPGTGICDIFISAKTVGA